MGVISAGLMMYRLNPGLEVFLVHPGGPIFRKKDLGYWSIPKGLSEPDEALLQTACREFQEETGITPHGPYLDLGMVRQKGGKQVHAWAFDTRSNVPATYASNQFKMEWPPRSGKFQSFPEIDKYEWFTTLGAEQKMNSAQVVFLQRLAALIQIAS